ncbi:MAG: hypothetical protein LBK06_03355 [Planctomycetaceae bacterium]|jgi:hypothetical protein|nr:hypothetical protein [Planctomycetaceae bacterium]
METIYGILETIFDIGVPLAVVAALYGTRWRERFWGNILTVFALFFSMLIAVNWFEPLAHFVTGQSVGMLFLSDFLFLWLLFVVSFALMNEVTRLLSRVNVCFPIPVENVGNFVSITVMLCLVWGFYGFSLDVAPLGATAKVTTSDDSTPISIFRQLSSGNLSTFGEKHPFDEYGEFRRDHLLRRQALMQYRLKSDAFPFFYEGDLPPMKGFPNPPANPENNNDNNNNENPPAPPTPEANAPNN